MAAITKCSDFGAQENKIHHCFHFIPIHLPGSDEMDPMIFVFLMLSFKPDIPSSLSPSSRGSCSSSSFPLMGKKKKNISRGKVIVSPNTGPKGENYLKGDINLWVFRHGGFPSGLAIKNLLTKQEMQIWSLGSGRYPGKWNGNPFQDSCPHGQRSLTGYSSLSCKQLDTTELLSTHVGT